MSLVQNATQDFLADRETDKTDKTDIVSVSNHEFLTSVFGLAQINQSRPMIVSFVGDPTTVDRSAWKGTNWIREGHTFSLEENNYFTLADFRPDESGIYRRRKMQFSGLHAIMLDDVGTKVSFDRLALECSWMLETSPQNYQVGYILAEPLKDAKQADRLMKAIIEAELCDPGAGGPTTRLARLPVASNGKHNPAFRCKMTVWEPSRKYSADDIISGFELDVASSTKSRKALNKRTSGALNYSDSDSVFIPCPSENPVIAALYKRNLYKTPLGEGKHDITCPWVAEHTNADDKGTAYFEPNGSYRIGGFKCHHGHCADRHIRDLLAYLDVEAKAASMKSTIRIIAGEIHSIAEIAERELAKTGCHYQRGGLIVTVSTDPGTKETTIRPISQPALVRILSAIALWERLDRQSQEWVRTDPPARHTLVLHDATSYTDLLPLNVLARQPYFRSDGSLVKIPGYDTNTAMFGVFNGGKFTVGKSPSKTRAAAALELLKGLLDEFRFASDTDMAAALAALITAAVRCSLINAPMFHIRAPQIASGKSYLCKLITAFATPQNGSPSTFPSDDEECRKFILASLLCGPAVIEFDNLTSDLLAHKSLCIALTEEFMTGRILGVSKTATVSTRTLFLSSGNNVGPIQDMTRRCITINLDPACETPATRDYKKPDLLGEVLKNREVYVSAALTIVCAWIHAGRPQTECKPFNSYKQWSDFCRQPLLWLGLDDPVSSVFKVMGDDPDRETLGRLLEVWQALFDRKPTMIRQAVTQADCAVFSEITKEFREILIDIAGEKGVINRRVLGRWITRHSGRIVNGLKFVRATGSRSAEAWFVESVSSVLSGEN